MQPPKSDAAAGTPVDIETRYIWKDPPTTGIVFPKGSQLEIGINDEVGQTNMAGLTFKEECTITFGEDYTILVDKDGIEVMGSDGNTWVSRKAQLDGKEVIAFFPKQ